MLSNKLYSITHSCSYLVNGVFTTTFTGASVKPVGNQKQLLELNKFQWTEQYGVLLSMTYKGGMQVRKFLTLRPQGLSLKDLQISAATDSQKLQFGEKTTFDDEDKVLSDPATATATEFEDGATPTDSFVVGNVPDYLHASVACKESPGSNKWLVLYVDQVQHSGPMNKTLTPINTVRLVHSTFEIKTNIH